MIKMVKRKTNVIYYLLKVAMLYITLLIIVNGCWTQKNKSDSYCIQKAFDYILENDYESKLHSNKELLLIVNFILDDALEFKAALLPKKTYPQYLTDKNEKAVGYMFYKGLTIIGYGDASKYLMLKKINKRMVFLEPFQVKKPDSGNPPFPPFDIEPLVYTYVVDNGCFKLNRKTVADVLID